MDEAKAFLTRHSIDAGELFTINGKLWVEDELGNKKSVYTLAGWKDEFEDYIFEEADYLSQ